MEYQAEAQHAVKSSLTIPLELVVIARRQAEWPTPKPGTYGSSPCKRVAATTSSRPCTNNSFVSIARLTFSCALLFLAPAAHAQHTSPSLDSHGPARAQILEAIDALGGLEKLRSISSIAIHGTGTVFRSAQMQGLRPGVPSPASRDVWLAIDLPNNRASLEYDETRSDGSRRWRRFSYTDDERTVVEFVNRFAARAHFADAARIRRDLMRRVPHFLLLDAFDHVDSLRALGDSVFAGEVYHVIAYQVPEHKAALQLFIHALNHRLAKVAYAMDLPGIGDTGVELIFAPYDSRFLIGAFPSGHTMLIDGDTLEIVQYREVLANDPRVDVAFRIPDDIVAQSQGTGAVSQPAPSVYVVTAPGGFTTMFVEFRDFVLEVEAPSQAYLEFDQLPADGLPPSDTVSEWLIRKIKETIPNKPIRYVVVSHYHNDHAGGVRAFWAEGATLLTTPGTRAYFEKLGSVRLSISPDRLSHIAGHAANKIETIDHRRTITDGYRTADIINVGHTLHTDEALVVYLPKERFIYQGDQFYFDGNATFPPRDRLPIMREFAAWITRMNLPVERIYGTHMTGYATMQHVDLVLHWPPTDSQTRSPPPASKSGEARIPADSLVEDLRRAQHLLIRAHPGVYRFVSAAQLDSEFQRAVANIDRPMTTLDFYRQLVPAVCAIKDGHTSVALPTTLRNARRSETLLLPFYVRIDGDTVAIVRDLSNNGRLSGAIVTAINGESIGTVLLRMRAAVCADGDISTARDRQLDGWAFSTLLADIVGLRSPFAVTVRLASGARDETLGIEGVPLDRLTSEASRRWPPRRPPPTANLGFLDNGQIANLTIRAFHGSVDGNKTLDDFFQESFDTIAQHQAQSLILDVRDNGGGDDHLGAVLLSYVVSDSVRYYDDLVMSSFAKSLVPAADVTALPSRFMVQLPDGRYRLSGHPAWGTLAPRKPQFRGKMFVLMNGGSLSTTGEFLTHLAARQRATFIGEESGGSYYGNSSGFFTNVTLPNSGIELEIPLVAYSLAVPPGHMTNRGVHPTYHVSPSVRERLTGSDPEFALALKLARSYRTPPDSSDTHRP